MSNHHFHQSAGPFTVLLFYYFMSVRFQAEVFASRVAKPECRTTIFSGRPDSPRVVLHLGQEILHVGSRFCMSAKRIPTHPPPIPDLLNRGDATKPSTFANEASGFCAENASRFRKAAQEARLREPNPAQHRPQQMSRGIFPWQQPLHVPS